MVYMLFYTFSKHENIMIPKNCVVADDFVIQFFDTMKLCYVAAL